MSAVFVLDERHVWFEAIIAAAERAGHRGQRVFSGHQFDDVRPGDIGFLRCHADWRVLPANREDYARMLGAGLLTIQDQGQVDTYERKDEQFRRWFDLMPETWLHTDADAAMGFLDFAPFPLVSKANEGASSTTVRILKDKAEAQKHIAQLFGAGIWVHHGANCPQTKQRGYALLQRFIPHTITYRVNVVGNVRAVFFRRNYPDRPVAQTGNTTAAYEMTPELESLLEYADRVAEALGTKWCALDILKDGDGWKFIESSLAWPWAADSYADATMFRSTKGRKWAQMFDVMFDEVERGAWNQ